MYILYICTCGYTYVYTYSIMNLHTLFMYLTYCMYVLTYVVHTYLLHIHAPTEKQPMAALPNHRVSCLPGPLNVQTPKMCAHFRGPGEASSEELARNIVSTCTSLDIGDAKVRSWWPWWLWWLAIVDPTDIYSPLRKRKEEEKGERRKEDATSWAAHE
jgi:hypothetical protein